MQPGHLHIYSDFSFLIKKGAKKGVNFRLRLLVSTQFSGRTGSACGSDRMGDPRLDPGLWSLSSASLSPRWSQNIWLQKFSSLSSLSD